MKFFKYLKGGGRKTMDPQMETLLFDWCLDEIRRNKKPVSRSLIKQQAKYLSQNKSSFKASKGWLDKFMKRFNYSEKTKEILSDIREFNKKELKIEEKNNSKNNLIPIKLEVFYSLDNHNVKKPFNSFNSSN